MSSNVSLDWRGADVYKTVAHVVLSGLTQFAGEHETAAKARVYPNHGKITGTYQRSIHYAPPTYNFGGDNVRPSPSSPDRSGQGGSAKRNGDIVSIVVGSGMVYARKLENLYSPIMGGYRQVEKRLPEILESKAREAGLE